MEWFKITPNSGESTQVVEAQYGKNTSKEGRIINCECKCKTIPTIKDELSFIQSGDSASNNTIIYTTIDNQPTYPTIIQYDTFYTTVDYLDNWPAILINSEYFGNYGVMVFNDNLFGIGINAFSGNTALTSIIFPDGLINLGVTWNSDSLVRGCSNLTAVTIGRSTVQLPYSNTGGTRMYKALSYANIKELTIRSEQLAQFVQYPSVSDYTITNLFYGSSHPDKIIFDITGDTINTPCRGATGITSVTIPATVRNIDNYAFTNCNSLSEINYGGTIQQWLNTSTEMAISYGWFTPLQVVHCIDGDYKITKMSDVSIHYKTTDNIKINPTVSSPYDILNNSYCRESAYYKGIGEFKFSNVVRQFPENAFSGKTTLSYIEFGTDDTYTFLKLSANCLKDCTSLNTIKFRGTIAEWNGIEKENDWNYGVPASEVICNDGIVLL